MVQACLALFRSVWKEVFLFNTMFYKETTHYQNRKRIFIKVDIISSRQSIVDHLCFSAQVA